MCSEVQTRSILNNEITKINNDTSPVITENLDDLDNNSLYVNAIIMKDTKSEDISVTIPESLKLIQESLFKINTDQLLPHRNNINMEIDILEGKLSRTIPMIRFSYKEKFEAKKETDDLLVIGWARRLIAAAPAKILFLEKPHSKGLRICIDFQHISPMAIKDKYSVPNIDDLVKIRGAKLFTRLDIISAYNMIRIAPGHE